jgi:hypothetical protein
MKKKFILGIFVLGILLTAVFVSAGLFSFNSPMTGNVVAGTWTTWYDRDDASGSGDYEELSKHGDVCGDVPITGIECQTTDGVDYKTAGQKVTCDMTKGFACISSNNGGSMFNPTCEDYKVRYKCGESESVCGNGIQEPGEQCDGTKWSVHSTCSHLVGTGYTGELSCTSSCTFDTSGCVSSTTNTKSVLFNRNDEKVILAKQDESHKYYLRASNFIVDSSLNLNKVDFQIWKDNSWQDQRREVREGDTFFLGELQFDVGKIDRTNKLVVLSISKYNGNYLQGELSLVDEKVLSEDSTTNTEVTYQGVLDMLSKCEIKSKIGNGGNQVDNCATICQSYYLKCAFGVVSSLTYREGLFSCSEASTIGPTANERISCMCCSA